MDKELHLLDDHFDRILGSEAFTMWEIESTGLIGDSKKLGPTC